MSLETRGPEAFTFCLVTWQIRRVKSSLHTISTCPRDPNCIHFSLQLAVFGCKVVDKIEILQIYRMTLH